MPSRAQKKRARRAHDRRVAEEQGQQYDPKSGQFFVLLWPGMKKIKGLNWQQAQEIWRNAEDRAMIFADGDDR